MDTINKVVHPLTLETTSNSLRVAQAGAHHLSSNSDNFRINSNNRLLNNGDSHKDSNSHLKGHMANHQYNKDILKAIIKGSNKDLLSSRGSNKGHLHNKTSVRDNHHNTSAKALSLRPATTPARSLKATPTTMSKH